MDSQDQTAIYELSIYTNSNTLRGEISCPIGLRLSDLFNIPKSDFLEFINVGGPGIKDAECARNISFIKKDSIEIIGVSPADAGRGAGANSGVTSYPFVAKRKVSVTLQLQSYHLSGSINLLEGQTIQGLLNENKQFLPLTEVIIGSEQGQNESWPFAIVNKKHLVLLRENQNDRA